MRGSIPVTRHDGNVVDVVSHQHLYVGEPQASIAKISRCPCITTDAGESGYQRRCLLFMRMILRPSMLGVAWPEYRTWQAFELASCTNMSSVICTSCQSQSLNRMTGEKQSLREEFVAVKISEQPSLNGCAWKHGLSSCCSQGPSVVGRLQWEWHTPVNQV